MFNFKSKFINVLNKDTLHNLKLIFLFLFFSVSSVLAQGFTEGQALFEQYVPNWLPLFSAAILIGFSLVGITFMISKVFNLPQLETWSKTELFEIVGSSFLVVILLIVIGIIDNLFVAAVEKTPMNASIGFLDSMSAKLINAYLDTIDLGYSFGILSGPPPQYTLANLQDATTEQGSGSNFRFVIVGLNLFQLRIGNPFGGADSFTSFMSLIQSISLSALIVSIFSKALLSFVWNIALPVAVPIGLFFSFFSFTRKMGRTLIAFGIGLYIFLPLSIMLFQVMYDSAYKVNTPVPAIPKPDKVDSFNSAIRNYALVDFLGHLSIGIISAVKFPIEGPYTYYPSCITSALTHLPPGPWSFVLVPIYTLICTLIQTLFTAPANVDLFEKIEPMFHAIRVVMLGNIIGTDVSSYVPVILTPSIIALPTILSSLFSISANFPFLPDVGSLLMNILTALSQYFSNLALLGAYVALNKDLGPYVTNLTLDYIPYILQYAVPFALLPFIILTVVITGIRSISPAIGGEVQILGLSELV